MTNVIDDLVGIEPGSALDVLRRSRPVRRDGIEDGYRALFEPADAGEVSLAARFAVAAFTADVQNPDGVTGQHYFSALQAIDASLAERVAAIAAAGRQSGPWGTYRESGLQAENVDGEWFALSASDRDAVGEPLAAVLEHAHFLSLHPRDARPEVLQRLVDAGWSRPAIVTLSQLVSYVSFQVRVVEGLRVLRAEGEGA